MKLIKTGVRVLIDDDMECCSGSIWRSLYGLRKERQAVQGDCERSQITHFKPLRATHF